MKERGCSIKDNALAVMAKDVGSNPPILIFFGKKITNEKRKNE